MTRRTRKTVIIIVVACVSSGVLIIAGLMALAIYGHESAQRAGNEAATQQNLKTIAAVEIQYYNTHMRTFGTFDQLIKEEMLTSKFSGNPPVVDGYVLKLNILPGTSTQPGSYTLNADPQRGTTARTHFYLDSTSATIHVNPDRPAGPTDPPLGQ
jgi:hypothetical protein